MNSIKHSLLYRFARVFHFRWLFRLCRRYLYNYEQIQTHNDWGKPQKPFFFKKEADLYSWYYQAPTKGVEWLEQGVYARREMFNGCLVLDLCTGDGFFPYMFYSDFASRIDCVDFDKDAVEHAKQNYSLPNIAYYQDDILKGEFPGNGYDVVIWNTAMDYFSREQLDIVFDKILRSSKPSMVFVGAVPKVGKTDKKHSDNHVAHFTEEGELRTVLQKYFQEVNITFTDYKHRSTFYYQCRGLKG